MGRWRKILGWTAVGVGVLVLLVVVGGTLLLKTGPVHNYVLSKIQQKAQQALGSNVEINNFNIHPLSLSADISGLTVHGKGSASQKPLLTVQKGTVGLKMNSIIPPKVSIGTITIQHPVVNLIANQQGQFNIPNFGSKSSTANNPSSATTSSGDSSSGTNLFSLGIGHLQINNGVIHFRDRKLPLNADLRGLQTQLQFHKQKTEYTGSISYQNGTIDYDGLQPLSNSMHAQFSVTPTDLDLNQLVLHAGGSRVEMQASVKNYNTQPVATGKYYIVLHTNDVSGLVKTADLSGDVTLAGTWKYRDVPNVPAIRTAEVHGSASSNGIVIVSNQGRIHVENIDGQYQLANGDFSTKGFIVDLLNGKLTVDGKILNLGTTPKSNFKVALSGISLNAVKSSLAALNQSLPVTGTLNADARIAWVGSVSNMRATSTVRVRGAVLAARSSANKRFPLNADLHFNYDRPRNRIAIPNSYIHLPATTINAHGEIGGATAGFASRAHSRLDLKVNSSDLHQLMLLAAGVAPETGSSVPAQTSALATLQGSLQLNATVQGTMKSPQISAQLTANKVQLRQSRLKSLQIALNASPTHVSIQNGSVVLPEGHATFNARAALHQWSYQPSGNITATLQVHQIPLDQLEQFAGKSYPVSGDLNGNIQFDGSELNPAGHGQLEVTNAKFQNESISPIKAQFVAANGTIQSEISQGPNTATLHYTPKSKSYLVSLTIPQQQLTNLPFVSGVLQSRHLPIKGQLAINASGKGTISNPGLTATVQLTQLQLSDTTIPQVRADLELADHIAKVSLNSSGGPATLAANATVHVSPGYYTEASINTSQIPFQPFLATYYPAAKEVSGETELHGTLRGPLANRNKLEAHLTIPTLQASYQKAHVENTSPLQIDYANSVVILRPSGFKGTDTSMRFQGRIPLQDSQRMNLSLNGSVGLRLAELFSPDLHTGGAVVFDVTADGTLKNPAMHGQVKLQNAMFASQTLPFGVSKLNATMQLTDKAIQVVDATGRMGGGDIKFGGSITYRPQLQANVSMVAKSVRIRYPEGVRTVFDSDLVMTGNAKSATLQGRVLIDSLSFTSDFDISSFVGQFAGVSVPTPAQESFTNRLKLQVTVQSSNQLNAGTAQIGIEGQANVRVIGTAANPVVVGRADITSADIFFNKRQYHVAQGIINFINPNKTEPVLNLLITTTVNQYDLSVRLKGPIQKLETSYISDPPLPPIDIINLIARGTTTEGVPESFGAKTVIAQGLSQVESAVGSNISKLTGISGLQIDPLVGGNNTHPSTRIGVQKRVTKNFIFTFSTDVTQPQNEVIQGEYQLDKHWAVSVARDENGGFSVDGRYRTKF